MAKGNTLTKRELELKLTELEKEYELARKGMFWGPIMAILSLIAGLMCLGGALYAFLEKRPGFLSGTHLVIFYLIMAFALIIYFSFVFGRRAKLKAQITKTKKLLEMSSGERVR